MGFHQALKHGPRHMLQKPMIDTILVAPGVDPPSRVRNLAKTHKLE